jgi:hypothetical protein
LLFLAVLLESESCLIDKMKTVEIESGNEVCDSQMKLFVESVKNDEKWAVESKKPLMFELSCRSLKKIE